MQKRAYDSYIRKSNVKSTEKLNEWFGGKNSHVTLLNVHSKYLKDVTIPSVIFILEPNLFTKEHILRWE
jgi:hypothetical protein